MDSTTALPYTVEPMRLIDLDEVMHIERLTFSAPWSERAYRYEITQNEYSTMVVARAVLRGNGWSMRLLQRFGLVEPGPVLGYAGFWLLVDEMHVSTIAVHPEWRGQGLGELLLISLLDRGAARNAHKATLEVRVSNLTAQALYRKLGFTIVARIARYYSDNNEDAFIMATPPLGSPGFQANLRQCRIRLLTRLQGQSERTGKESKVV
jgi:[ribosomal protein S18]-alanine N-acetyltransferase